MTGTAGPEHPTGRPVGPALLAGAPAPDRTGVDRAGTDPRTADRAGTDPRTADLPDIGRPAADQADVEQRGPGFPRAEEADSFEPEQRDWAWVEEWREGNEPMPWGPGLAVAGFTGFLVASAVYVLCSGLSSRPLVAIAVNVVVVAGLCPALWLSRGLPVLRWIAGGAAAGVLVAWLSVLVFLA